MLFHKKNTFHFVYIASAAIVLVAGWFFHIAIHEGDKDDPQEITESKTENKALEDVEPYPVGKLIVTEERENYKDGQLKLYIPRMDFMGEVYNGTEDEALSQGVGLFEYSQLPSNLLQNDNVSIAGHRDLHGRGFYNIDKIVEGDSIYVLYNNTLYTYQVEEIFITTPEDWDPIRVKNYPRITLQSCTPIGIASDRIFVVGRLIDVAEGKALPNG